MSRTWTSRAILTSGVAKADDMNRELTDLVRAVNGDVGQHQLPIGGITTAKLIPMGTEATYASGTLSTFGATSSYHRSAYIEEGEAFGNLATIEPQVDVARGWRFVSSFMPSGNTNGSVLQFRSREGMIHGAAGIDVVRRASYIVQDDAGTLIPIATHQYDWWQIGVFANGIQVADSGKLYPRRHTLDLPFAFPAPAGDCRIDTRIRYATAGVPAPGTTIGGIDFYYPPPAVEYPPIDLGGVTLWCRNRYR